MKKIAFSLFFFTYLLFAQSPEELFEQANQQYRNGNYVDAIELYNQLIDNNYESPELYYNLGNSYFKIDAIGYAILYYEKTLSIAPNFEDAEFNLSLASARTVDKIKEVPELFILNWWKSLLSQLSVSSWAILFTVFFILLLLKLTIYLTGNNLSLQRNAFYLSIIALILVFILGIALYSKYYTEKTSEYGVIVTKEVSVKNSPDELSNDAFIIHEGLKIRLLDKVDNWYNIKIPDGKIGWISETSFEKI